MIIRGFISILLLTVSSFVSSNSNDSMVRWQYILNADHAVFEEFKDGMTALTAAHLPTNDSGLIGRNLEWGALFSPRFQVGAGNALRMTLAASRPAEAKRAFRAIEAGVDVFEPNGFVPSTLPSKIGGKPSSADIVSGAAFFLGDACLGILALEATKKPDVVASSSRRGAVREKLGLALNWLLTQQDVLLEIDLNAPNRLLFNALAFQACGSLSSVRVSQEASNGAVEIFVSQALSLYQDEGNFIEGGGHDTSYQGVAIRVGEDVLLAGYLDPKKRLRNALSSAAQWLSDRVGPDGRINSAGNTRTCWSDEKVFNKPKLVSISAIFSALAYSGMETKSETIIRSAKRIEKWASSNRGSNPCYRP